MYNNRKKQQFHNTMQSVPALKSTSVFGLGLYNGNYLNVWFHCAKNNGLFFKLFRYLLVLCIFGILNRYIVEKSKF